MKFGTAIVGLPGFVVGYVIGVSEERQSDLPIAVGNADSQQRFISEHAESLREHHKIHLLLTKIFIRPLARPSEEGIEGLPDDDPAVIAFENKIIANRLIFYLGRTAADDFGELLVLAGNGYGVGALKILRGMYERMVTAAFLATKPSEARIFAEDDTIKKWKLWREHVEIIPELEDGPATPLNYSPCRTDTRLGRQSKEHHSPRRVSNSARCS